MANVYKGELTLVEPEIRRMMHAKVPVIQMWVNIPYAWDMCKRALNSEFGFKDVNELTDLVPASSKYFVEGTLIPRNVNFKYPPITTLLEEGNEKKIIVSAKDDSATEEYKTINSIGITSFVGLEAFKEEYRKCKEKKMQNTLICHIYYYFSDALSLMLGNALETRKDIVVTNSLNITQKGSQNIIEETFSVASRSMFSNVSYVKFNCGYGEQESIAMGQDNLAQFTCSPKESGTYKIVLIVFTTSENRFLFTYNRTVGISSASGLAPTFLLAAFAAFLFLLGK